MFVDADKANVIITASVDDRPKQKDVFVLDDDQAKVIIVASVDDRPRQNEIVVRAVTVIAVGPVG